MSKQSTIKWTKVKDSLPIIKVTDDEYPNIRESDELIFITKNGIPFRGNYYESVNELGRTFKEWYVTHGEEKGSYFDIGEIEVWCYAPEL